MKTFYLTITLLFFYCLAQAQNDTEMTILYMKDGSRLEGSIISEDENEIKFRLFGDYEMTVPVSEVEKRTKGKPGRKYFPDGRWTTIRGYYSVLSFCTTWGKDDDEFGDGEVLTGLKLQTIHGYKFNQYVSLGVSLGIHSFEMPSLQDEDPFAYSSNVNFTTFPLELDVRGYLNENRISPYYAVNAGYGIAIFNNEEFLSREGGLTSQLELGVRFAGRKTGGFQLGMGYTFQDVQAVYEIDRFTGSRRFVNLDSRLHRFMINFGWSF